MFILIQGYQLCLLNKHPLLSPPASRFTIPLSFFVTLIGFTYYIVFADYDIFLNLFTAQTIIFLLICSHTMMLRPTFFKKYRHDFFMAIAYISFGKGLWSIERKLYHDGNCPSKLYNPLFWLHPGERFSRWGKGGRGNAPKYGHNYRTTNILPSAWHFLSAASHIRIMKFLRKLNAKQEIAM